MNLAHDTESHTVAHYDCASAGVERIFLIENVAVVSADVLDVGYLHLAEELLNHALERIEVSVAAVHTDSESLRFIRERVFVSVLLLTV